MESHWCSPAHAPARKQVDGAVDLTIQVDVATHLATHLRLFVSYAFRGQQQQSPPPIAKLSTRTACKQSKGKRVKKGYILGYIFQKRVKTRSRCQQQTRIFQPSQSCRRISGDQSTDSEECALCLVRRPMRCKFWRRAASPSIRRRR